MIFDDTYFMREALKEAKKAEENGEIPIGAVLVHNKAIVCRAYNQTELLKDVTAHAEILAITSACANLGSKFLNDFELYVTLEPCAMCAGAIKWSRVGKLVYGATDKKAGYNLYSPAILHPKTIVVPNILEEECLSPLQNFFHSKRKKM